MSERYKLNLTLRPKIPFGIHSNHLEINFEMLSKVTTTLKYTFERRKQNPHSAIYNYVLYHDKAAMLLLKKKTKKNTLKVLNKITST